MPASAEEVFRWHEHPGALERLTPPWEPMKIEQRPPGIRNGDRGVLVIHIGPVPIRWRLEHRDYVEGRQFRDVQLSGPFRRWEHTHRFIPVGEKSSYLEDRIVYELPFGILGKVFGDWFTRRKLKKLFDYRHRVTAEAMWKRDSK